MDEFLCMIIGLSSLGAFLLSFLNGWIYSTCDVPFSGVPYGMVRMDFQSWGQMGHRGGVASSMGPWALEGF